MSRLASLVSLSKRAPRLDVPITLILKIDNCKSVVLDWTLCPGQSIGYHDLTLRVVALSPTVETSAQYQ